VTIADLFPLCNAKRCPQRGTHKHPLPHQLDLINAREKYLCQKGGYGSAKSMGAAVLIMLLGQAIPGNRIFVGRRSIPKLNDPTKRIFLEVLQRSGIEGVRFHENRDGLPGRIVLPNETEYIFKETTEPGRFLGPEYGAFWIDEAQEEPESTFTGLMGRLRLGRAGEYLRGILTTNPPHQTHWIAARFGLDDGVKRIVDPETGEVTTYRLMSSSTRDNPHLPPGYLSDLLTGLTPGEIQRVVEGNYGFAVEGPPAYPQFQHARNVGEVSLSPLSPLVRAWDFGHRHPACTWHQVVRCRLGQGHWRILAELDAQRVESEVFADRVIALTQERFPDMVRALTLDCGDWAGAQVSEKGPGPIHRLASPPWSLQIAHQRCSIELDPIRVLLREVCPCRMPRLLVHRVCHNVIDGFAGGYHCHPRRPDDKPVKDGFYDDFMDTIRYAYVNYVREELRTPGALEAEAATQESNWAWMGGDPSEADRIAEIAAIKQRMMLQGR
jgi:hypothetical protein